MTWSGASSGEHFLASNPAPAGNGLPLGKGGLSYDVCSYGAVGDAQTITDAVMDGTTGIVTSASNKFKAADVGKKACVLLVGAAVVANPTVAIIAADGGVGATNLPTGTYKFAYDWAIRGFNGATTKGTSEATYVQTVANHIITLTVPAIAAPVEVTEIFCTQAPGGAFIGIIGIITGTVYSYVTGLLSTGRVPGATTSAGATLQTTIASFQSAGQVTLAAVSSLPNNGTAMLWGTIDDTARDAAHNAAKAAKRGTVTLPPVNPAGGPAGYLFTTTATTNIPEIGFAADIGTPIYYIGASDCFRVQLSPFDTNGQPGQLRGMVVDGRFALDGACGIHYGDANQGAFIDVTVRYFNGVGSKNIWFDNRTNWCERHDMVRVWSHLGTIGVLYDVNGGDVSFAHSWVSRLKLSVGPGQVGTRLQNGAARVNSDIHETGNCDVASTFHQLLDTAKDGGVGAGNDFVITPEDSATATLGTATGLSMSAGSVLFGSGVINFALGNFTNTNAGNGNIQFSGYLTAPGIYTAGGESLMVFGTGLRASGNSRMTGDTVALALQRTAGAQGGRLGFNDQAAGLQAQIGIDAVDNAGFVMSQDGTKKILWSNTGTAVNGNPPTGKAGAIATPNAQTGSYVQADVASLKTAIDAIRVALTNYGITA